MRCYRSVFCVVSWVSTGKKWGD